MDHGDPTRGNPNAGYRPDANARGCILVGLNYYGNLVRSKTYFETLYRSVEEAMKSGEDVSVEIK